MTYPGEVVTVFTYPYSSALAPALGEAKGLIRKIFICFENLKKYGYISEKLFDSFQAGIILIYFGYATITKLINFRAYIYQRYIWFEKKIEFIFQK